MHGYFLKKTELKPRAIFSAAHNAPRATPNGDVIVANANGTAGHALLAHA
jgi:hypothetical protein